MKYIFAMLMALPIVLGCNSSNSNAGSLHDKRRIQELENQLNQKDIELLDKEDEIQKAQSPEVLRKSLGDIERDNPLGYLELDYSVRYKLLSGLDAVQGRIYSSASVTEFKDVNIVVSCYSKTNSLIKTFDYTVYEFVQPQKSASFELTFKSPKGTKTIGAKIVGASY